MYKVEFNTVALMKDGTTGNISQGLKTAYTDADLENIHEILNEHLKPEKLVAIIDKVTRIEGEVLSR